MIEADEPTWSMGCCAWAAFNHGQVHEPGCPEQVICGHRDVRTTGTYECVSDPDHEPGRHYYVRLNEGN